MTRALARTKPERGSKDDIPWYGRAIERGVPWLIRNVPPRAWLALPLWIVAVLLASVLHVDARSVWPLALLLGGGCAAVLWAARGGASGAVTIPMLGARVPRRVLAPTFAALAGVWLALAWWRGGWLLVLLVPLVLAAVGAMVFGPRRKVKEPKRRAHTDPTAAQIVKAWPELTAEKTRGGRILGGSIAHVLGTDDVGWRVHVELGSGGTRSEVADDLEKVESVLDLREGTLRVLPAEEGRARACVLRAVTKDLLDKPRVWPGPSAKSILETLRIGTYEDGEPATISLVPTPGQGRSMIVGGASGYGKSSLLNLLAGSIAGCADAALGGIDLEETEFAAWEDVFSPGWLATGTMENARKLIDRLEALREQRRARLARERRKFWVPTPDDPELFILIDELALLSELMERISKIASICRKTGIHLILATQRPSNQSVSKWAGEMKAQLAIQVCLHVASPTDVNIVLGSGSAGAGWRADLLCRRPGDVLIRSTDREHGLPRLARTDAFPDDGEWEARLAASRTVVEEVA